MKFITYICKLTLPKKNILRKREKETKHSTDPENKTLKPDCVHRTSQKKLILVENK